MPIPGAGNKFQDMINQVIDPTLVMQVKDNLGVIGEMLGGYGEKAKEAFDGWMEAEGGALIAGAKAEAAKFAGKAGGDEAA
eukprot:SAG22_NODE_5162_length_1074_cov_0.998974_2_plen_80_part_01